MRYYGSHGRERDLSFVPAETKTRTNVVLNNLVFPAQCCLQGLARRPYCHLYLRAAAVCGRKLQAFPVKWQWVQSEEPEAAPR